MVKVTELGVITHRYWHKDGADYRQLLGGGSIQVWHNGKWIAAKNVPQLDCPLVKYGMESNRKLVA